MQDVSDDTHTARVPLGARALAPWLALASTLFGVACDTDAPAHEAPSSGAGSPADDAAQGGSGNSDVGNGDDELDWCAARRVLEAKCQRCHTAPPEHGAPFPLVAYDDVTEVSARGAARFVTIEAALTSDFMPPTFIDLQPPVLPLSEPEKALLLRWCSLGAPPAATDPCPP
jgi:hypothetical protein